MVKSTAKTPRVDFVIKGNTYNIVTPYAEGHALTANEAGVLNQTLRENTRNNMVTALAKILAEGGDEAPAAAQTAIDEYVASYEFGQRKGGGGGRATDPVTKAAMDIARGLVRAAIKAKGLKISEVPAKRISELAVDAIKENPSITEQAKARVELLKQTAGEALDLDFQV